DGQVNQLLISRFLEKLGLDVVITNNGQEAIDALSEAKFHIILMDLEMPVLGGIEATKEIRSKRLSMSPIIALTAHDDPETRKLCIKSRMNGFLLKPLDLNAIIQELDKFLS
ncbi:MAG: hypothetical protein DRQ47_08695, partial [Gammaproteobacteria bacterium]